MTRPQPYHLFPRQPGDGYVWTWCNAAHYVACIIGVIAPGQKLARDDMDFFFDVLVAEQYDLTKAAQVLIGSYFGPPAMPNVPAHSANGSAGLIGHQVYA